MRFVVVRAIPSKDSVNSENAASPCRIKLYKENLDSRSLDLDKYLLTGRMALPAGVPRENVCRKCGEKFVAKSHRALDCPPCVKVRTRELMAGHRARNPGKTLARSRFGKRLQRGLIQRPTACSSCGVACKPQGHHPDYSKPLHVVWLCHGCHVAAHASASPLPSPIVAPRAPRAVKPERSPRKRRLPHLRFVIVTGGAPA